MLPRTLEPEVMDELGEAMAYDDMDHSEVNTSFVSDLINFMESLGDDNETLEIVDLGAGTARIPIQLVESSERVRVVATDMSANMLDIARVNVELAGVTDRIMLCLADSKQTEFDNDRFDVVISNSLVHHVPDPGSVIAEAIRIVRPGGLIFMRDLFRPASSDQVDQLVECYAADEPDAARKMFRDSLHAALTVEEMQSLVSQLGFPSATVAATSDRHWTWQAVTPSVS